jgi:hypothetical protein
LGSTKCGKCIGSQVATKRVLVFKQPILECTWNRQPVYSSSELGGMAKLGESACFFVLDPLKKKWKAVGSNLEDSLLSLATARWYGMWMVAGQPFTKFVPLVTWLLVSECPENSEDCQEGDEKKHEFVPQ